MATQSRPVIGVVDPYHAAAMQKLENQPDVKVLYAKMDDMALIKAEAEAIMVRSDSLLTKREFDSYKKLKYVVKQGVGVDNIDLEAAKSADVQVYNTPGLTDEVVAELALGMSLSLARRIPEIDRAIRSGQKVVRSQTLGRSLYRKTLGIIGMGGIGTTFARKWLGAMEGNVLGYDPYQKKDVWSKMANATRVESLSDLLRQSDVVSIHVPLNDSTRKMISHGEFQVMKEGVILLNCARGGILDEDALLHALASGRLGGVGLDAMEKEPPTIEHYAEFLRFQNVVMTPHIGSSTVENQAHSGLTVAELAIDLVLGNGGGNRLV